MIVNGTLKVRSELSTGVPANLLDCSSGLTSGGTKVVGSLSLLPSGSVPLSLKSLTTKLPEVPPAKAWFT